MNINSRNIVIVVFIDHIDEMHGLSAETEVTDPFFKIMMLIFNFFYQWCEKNLHLLLHHEHLRNFGVGVLADDVFELSP